MIILFFMNVESKIQFSLWENEEKQLYALRNKIQAQMVIFLNEEMIKNFPYQIAESGSVNDEAKDQRSELEFAETRRAIFFIENISAAFADWFDIVKGEITE